MAANRFPNHTLPMGHDKGNTAISQGVCALTVAKLWLLVEHIKAVLRKRQNQGEGDFWNEQQTGDERS